MLFISYFDANITNTINSLLPHNSFFDFIFSVLSLSANSLPIWLILILIILLIEQKQDKSFLVYFGVSFLSTMVLVNVILKNLFHRARPLFDFSHSAYICPTDYGFPSGHATGAFASAVILAHFDPKRKYLYYALAFLISLSRVYLHCHYFIDVLVGGIIGASVSYLIVRYHHKTDKYLKKKH